MERYLCVSCMPPWRGQGQFQKEELSVDLEQPKLGAIFSYVQKPEVDHCLQWTLPVPVQCTSSGSTLLLVRLPSFKGGRSPCCICVFVSNI